jgi:catechol 2,3-dioxygenase-like lactoylglutathione lyase family enzyme
MDIVDFHHVALVTRDLPRSVAFYRECFRLEPVERPAFKTTGAWFQAGAKILHIILNQDGLFHGHSRLDTGDGHFAMNVRDFEVAVGELKAFGFREDLPDGDPKRLVVVRNSPAGFLQAYILDPDLNMIEINSAA